jgi:hypothetical protein
MHTDPAFNAKRLAGLRAYHDTPEAKRTLAASLARFRANMTEEQRERLREHGRWLAREVLTPEVLARSRSPEARAKGGAKYTENRLGWCPPEMRDEYRHLMRSKRYSAAEARAIIEASIPTPAAAAPAPRRPMSFEEQLAAVAAGAALIPTFHPSRAAPEMTLGGVASGLF